MKSLIGWKRGHGFNKHGEKILYKNTLTESTINLEKVTTAYQLFIRNNYGSELFYKRFPSKSKTPSGFKGVSADRVRERLGK